MVEGNLLNLRKLAQLFFLSRQGSPSVSVDKETGIEGSRFIITSFVTVVRVPPWLSCFSRHGTMSCTTYQNHIFLRKYILRSKCSNKWMLQAQSVWIWSKSIQEKVLFYSQRKEEPLLLNPHQQFLILDWPFRGASWLSECLWFHTFTSNNSRSNVHALLSNVACLLLKLNS